jgi:hypothetical protein
MSAKDTMLFGETIPSFVMKDSTRKTDTLSALALLKMEKNAFSKAFSLRKKDSTRSARKSQPTQDSKPNLQKRPAPFLRFTGGYASYNFNYRSSLDTPYTEKNITQHQVLSTMNFTVAGLIPIRVNSFIRRSNSGIFRDITDVQVVFDAAAYRSRLASMMRERLLSQAPGADSMAGKLYALKKWRADQLGNWLKDPLTHQKVIEANEIVKVPKMTYNMGSSDSSNKKREDSLRRTARLFLDMYTRIKGEHDKLTGQADTLKHLYDQSIDADRKYKQLASQGGGSNPSDYGQWESQLQKYAPGTPELPAAYRWLLGLRTFGIGRNSVNSSELTAKNLSLNGVNIVYNSWYYFSLAAGLVDYRFRDFVVGNLQQQRQYMYVVRAGLGRLEKNYFILSYFGGEKQLLTTTAGSALPGTVKLTGFSAETKWQIQRNAYLIAEAAQSFSPDLQSSPPLEKSGWNISDRSNKALSLKFYSWMPATGSRLEAQYKFTGANFQSFNSFQTNAEVRAWYVKGEQNFFKRQLKLVASLRTNDFSNPYIVQDYKANTVFKSLSATFHRKKLPVITIAYMPMSQLTMVNNQLEESRFETLTASVSHFYKLGLRQASTNIVYTKFFNNSTDSGFIYYNSVNLYMGQTIFFRDFTATLALSHSKSSGYEYNVLEGNVTIPVSRLTSLGMGAKLNSLNEAETGVGGFFDANMLIGRSDRLTVRVEKGYLPGSGTAAKLVPNVLGNVIFTKTFK